MHVLMKSKYPLLTELHLIISVPGVLIVRVEGGVVAGGLRGQVEGGGRWHRLPPRHCQALSLYFGPLEMNTFSLIFTVPLSILILFDYFLAVAL